MQTHATVAPTSTPTSLTSSDLMGIGIAIIIIVIIVGAILATIYASKTLMQKNYFPFLFFFVRH